MPTRVAFRRKGGALPNALWARKERSPLAKKPPFGSIAASGGFLTVNSYLRSYQLNPWGKHHTKSTFMRWW
ncbi:hypothetical protein [Scytonema sp. HK-05]|uniref:hypothetical protein n=1 Tax=Scytonema sp. HK-05 TaxID=1137095 RepID=UPI0009379CF8|nr:hypothetical protein [Scytonema sp. HK-05]